jgi:hypothetical protein
LVAPSGTSYPPFGKCPRDRIKPIFRTGIERLGQAKIENLDRAIVAHLDVGRLQVAMDDAVLVSLFEGFGNLSSDLQ